MKTRRGIGRLSDEELRSRYAPAEMMELEIYPEIWDRGPDQDDDPLGYIIDAVGRLREGLGDAVKRGYGLMVSLD